MALLALLLASPCSAREAPESQLQDDLKRLIDRARDKVFPALVNIDVVSSYYRGGKEEKYRSVGSGVIIDSSGLVVTNYHVTRNGRKFRCTLSDKREVRATLVGEDALTDISVLQLDLESLAGEPPAHAAFGDSSLLSPGDFVIAMGSPYALSRSITLGIVSNTERVFQDSRTAEPEELELEEGVRTGLFTRWIQHDADIRPGNSGGPLVNLSGEVVGINELGGGAGFAIPSNLAREVAAELVEHGEVRRSWLGANVRPLQRTGIDEGVLINSVVEDSPAAKAGLEPGDLITTVDGESVTVRFAEEVPLFLQRIASLPVGSEVRLTYLREETTHETRAETIAFPKDKGDERAFRLWGLSAEEITPLLAQTHRLESLDGVLISGVRTGSPASEARPELRARDVLFELDGAAIRSLADLRQAHDEIMDRDPVPEQILVAFRRGNETMITLIKPRPEETVSPPRQIPVPWVGVETQPVYPDLAEQLGHAETTGFRVTRIYDNTTATDVGLEIGDLITALQGRDLRVRNPQDSGMLRNQLQRLPLDGDAVFTFLRGGEVGHATMSLERRPPAAGEAERWRDRDFECEVRELTFYDRADNRWGEDITGAMATSVESAGWAGLAGLQAGDLIQRVNGETVHDVAGFRDLMEQLRESRPDRVVFFVLRNVRTRLLFAEPEWTSMAEDQDEEEE